MMRQIPRNLISSSRGVNEIEYNMTSHMLMRWHVNLKWPRNPKYSDYRPPPHPRRSQQCSTSCFSRLSSTARCAIGVRARHDLQKGRYFPHRLCGFPKPCEDFRCSAALQATADLTESKRTQGSVPNMTQSTIQHRSVRVSDSTSSEDIVVHITTNGTRIEVDSMGRLLLQPTANGSGKHRPPRLYSYEESLKLVPWATDNPWILQGYRGRLSIKKALYSAIGCECMLSCSSGVGIDSGTPLVLRAVLRLSVYEGKGTQAGARALAAEIGRS